MARKKKELVPAQTAMNEKVLDAIAEALWSRIEQKVQELVDDSIDNIYISH